MMRVAGMRSPLGLAVALGVVLLAACRQDMHDQPKYRGLRGSSFFGDHRSARPLVAGTVARGRLNEDELLHTGKVDGQLVDAFPWKLTKEDLLRGKERFGIFCTPCHDSVGNGEGMIVKRGMKRPPSYHIQRLREAPAGYFFDVMTNGFGAMYDYSDRISVEDRWRVVGYLRALQLSQNATIEDVPSSERANLEKAN
jgi:hypothetical protein